MAEVVMELMLPQLTPRIQGQVPSGARAVGLTQINGKVVVLCQGNPENPPITKEFRTYQTGQLIDPEVRQRYIATINMNNGMASFHFFEVIE